MYKFARRVLIFGGYLVLIGFFNLAASKPSVSNLSALKPSVSKPPISKQSALTQQARQQQLFKHFQRVIQQIDQDLLAHQTAFKTDPLQLGRFVNQKILSQWDSQRTLKHLIGKKLWRQLTPQDIAALELRFEQTIQRYVREGMGLYDGQSVKTLRVQLNKLATRGLLTLRVEPIYLPAFNIQFKIAPLTEADSTQQSTSLKANTKQVNRWQLYDILVQGISYIKLKKNEYRRIIQNQGLNALLKRLDDKNQISNQNPQQSRLKHKTKDLQSGNSLQPVSQ
ncbi:MAG: ABC transporter substrate-binding protein [Enterobacterales bacterium]|nr:ABC transporter substrate-binding protein [Enterobacterales bacterium]